MKFINLLRAIASATLVSGLLLSAPAAQPVAAAVGDNISAHSHWDDPDANERIVLCYHIIDSDGTGGAEYAHLPFREQDNLNFEELQFRTDGFRLVDRINGTAYTVTPSYSVPLSYGVGDRVMVDLHAEGSTYTLYELNADQSDGRMLYQWSSSTYSRGDNISYYTVHGYHGSWDFIHAIPEDSVGIAHDIFKLEQNAIGHTAVTTSSTFDDITPASGTVHDAVAQPGKTYLNFGLPSGDNYSYDITVNKPGTGTFDFRDPSRDDETTFFQDGYLRLTLDTTPTLKVCAPAASGCTASQTYSAPAGSGVAGTYKVNLIGEDVTVIGPDGSTLITATGTGHDMGIRVRIAASDQTWTWTGTVNGASSGGGPTTTTLTPTADTYVSEAAPTTVYGTNTALRTKGTSGATMKSFVRFPDAPAGVTKATLRLFADSALSAPGFDVDNLSGVWDEATTDFANSTATVGSVIAQSGAVTSGTWVEVDVTAAVQAGETDFALTADPAIATQLHLDSREGVNAPQLVITSGS